ncbi:cell division protein FtsZ [Flavobacterium sp.]|uniref:cell division protein FtsZ n=1 Tax=Flavobacterium sp. TaxID=239 RepID=UPI0035276651
MSDFTDIKFNLPKNQSNVIKVIGVGGGGSNAINHMFKQGIKGVDFVVCNTDAQALQSSPVPNKIQLGVTLTEGLGAGANPEVGHQSALENISEIEKMLDTNTKMVFITAGMGGGTGTGAAPVIAQLAKERNILTVGIVTIPFQFEGKSRTEQAMIGVEKLRKQVDSLIVVNNNKLREVYGNLGYKAGYSKADEVLATAARGIAEVISQHYIQNIDLRDAKTVLADSGTAIMGSALATGTDRAKQAIVKALDSPLLNDNKITGAKQVLLLIVSGKDAEHEITIDEISEINEYIQSEAGNSANIIMGLGEDESLDSAISVTVIATGFNLDQQAEIVNTEPKKIIHSLEDEQKLTHDLSSPKPTTAFNNLQETENDAVEAKNETKNVEAETTAVAEKVVFNLEEETVKKNDFSFEITAPKPDLIETTQEIQNIDVAFEIVTPAVETTPFQNNAVKEIEVAEPKEITPATENINFSLELFETNETTKTEEPVAAIETENKVIKYSLDDYLEKENEMLSAKPVAQVKEEEKIDETLQFQVKQKETTPVVELNESTTSPIEMTIEESLRARVEERKQRMKEFNYKFNTASSQVDELEKVPAYKRQGLDVETKIATNNQSRMSLDTDSNDDLQLRSNNSFLHDNVD